jgi:uncharacterized phage protein (TIGR01671 family)
MNNRVIKFRFWDLTNKNFLFVNDNTGYGPLIDKDGKILFLDNGGSLDDWDNLILLQYTGLKDKNGKEIYEGDVLQNNVVSTFISNVMYENGSFYISFNPCISENNNLVTISNRRSKYFLKDFCDTSVVIGNVFENIPS